MSPHLKRWGHVGLPVSTQFIRLFVSVHSLRLYVPFILFLFFCPALSIVKVINRETLTQCWANIGPPSTTLSQHLAQYWATLSCLAPRRMQASVTDGGPLQLTDIGSMSACRPTLWTHHRQQKALSSVEWLMANAGDGGPVLNQHWVEVLVCWA